MYSITLLGPVTFGSDSIKYEAYAMALRNVAERFLVAMHGERCEDFDEGCECCRCRRWRLLDELLRNPFEETPGRDRPKKKENQSALQER